MAEHTRLEQISVTMDCCGRPVRLEVPFTLVTDPGHDCAQVVGDQVALARAVRVHLDTCEGT